MQLAPIILFTYNRPWHTRQTIEALQKNTLADESKLFIFSDGPKNSHDSVQVQEVRDYLRTVGGFKTVEIIEREGNIGLSKSIISGVTSTIDVYEKVIVLEDDLITSPVFLTYMNDALEMYKNDENVASVHGYVYPIKKQLPDTFFIKGADCWGWATWKRAWDIFEVDGNTLLNELNKRNLQREFNMDNSYPYITMLKDQIRGKNDSWAVRWYASAFLADMVTLYPGSSLVSNIGFDESGTHARYTNALDSEMVSSIQLQKIAIEENRFAKKEFGKYLAMLTYKNAFSRSKYMLQEFIKKNFFSPAWYSIFFNPYFISRRGLYLGIKKFSQEDKGSVLLDVGCGGKPYQHLFGEKKYIGIDVKGTGHKETKKNVDAYFDGSTIPFEDKKFDSIVCTQVLEHAEDPDTLLESCHRVLIDNGKVFITVPFVWNEHEIPYDFRRLTRYGLTQILEKHGFVIEKIETTGGVFRVMGQLISAFIFESLPNNAVLKMVVACVLCFPVQFLFLVLDTVFKNSWITLDYVVVAKKIHNIGDKSSS